LKAIASCAISARKKDVVTQRRIASCAVRAGISRRRSFWISSVGLHRWAESHVARQTVRIAVSLTMSRAFRIGR
jgi:hypothetical protein